MSATRITRLSFPALRLPRRDAHKLRGYFGNAFRAHSPLLHNHLEDGSLRYGYPMIQYKIVKGVPTILGVGDGAELLIEIFADVTELNINGQKLRAEEKELRVDPVDAGFLSGDLVTYEFETLYMPFSQEVYQRYRETEDRRSFLKKSLQGHLLMALKGLGIWLEHDQRVVAEPNLEATLTNFKNQRMTAFRGSFVTNVRLPELIGIGRSTSRGFGTLRYLDH